MECFPFGFVDTASAPPGFVFVFIFFSFAASRILGSFIVVARVNRSFSALVLEMIDRFEIDL